MPDFTNPFRPGAGHQPPYLAGRELEKKEFSRLMEQKVILENLVLTGLRGVGKTVLLDTFKPIAISSGWLWVGTDLSESASLTEERIALRLLTDVSVVTSSVEISNTSKLGVGFTAGVETVVQTLNYNVLKGIYDDTPGLVHDKLKTVLQLVWQVLAPTGAKGVVFAYDEAQNLSDQSNKDEYPLSVLLDVFQSIQKTDIPMMLALTGLPTLFPKLVESRTFAERMFRVTFLDKLSAEDSREAILKPISNLGADIKLSDESIDTVIKLSGGYPYFIQFICREVYDAFIQKADKNEELSVPVEEIVRKLDSDFFAGRWARATDRQREILTVIAELPNCDEEFTVQEIVEHSSLTLDKPFSSSHTSQILSTLSNNGLIFKNRHGKYSYAVPLLGQFIRRQADDGF